MIVAKGRRLSVRELLLPLLFVLLGIAIIILSIPGQGNTGFTGLGMSLSLIGTAIARSRIKGKNSNDRR